MPIDLRNSDRLAPPAGFAHASITPPDRIVQLAGQIGNDIDGNFLDGLAAQTAEQRRAETAARYDGMADLYAEMFTDELDYQPDDCAELADVVTRTRNRVERDRSPVMLDLGCGIGIIAKRLAEIDGSAPPPLVVGSDGSREMLGYARRQSPALPLSRAALNAAPFASGCADVVVCRFAIIHTPPKELGEIFREFARLLRPGGELLLWFSRIEGTSHGMVFDHKVAPAYRFHPESIEKLLQTSGFSATSSVQPELREIDRFPPALVRAHR